MKLRKGERWIVSKYGDSITIEGRQDSDSLIAHVNSLQDAPLLAAAPELYEALKQLTGFLTHDGLNTNPRLLPYMDESRKVLAKVEGKER